MVQGSEHFNLEHFRILIKNSFWQRHSLLLAGAWSFPAFHAARWPRGKPNRSALSWSSRLTINIRHTWAPRTVSRSFYVTPSLISEFGASLVRVGIYCSSPRSINAIPKRSPSKHQTFKLPEITITYSQMAGLAWVLFTTFDNAGQRAISPPHFLYVDYIVWATRAACSKTSGCNTSDARRQQTSSSSRVYCPVE